MTRQHESTLKNKKVIKILYLMKRLEDKVETISQNIQCKGRKMIIATLNF
jgi:hypothetical protein